MDPRTPGLRRYLYEHLFHQAVQRTQQATGRPIMVSAARRIREDVERRLIASGNPEGMDGKTLGISPVLAAIEESLAEGVTDFPGVFRQGNPSDPAYQAMQKSFFDMAGIVRSQDGVSVQPSPGKAGPRLPISPYDPCWAVRSTVKVAGSRELFVLGADMEQFAGNRADRLHELRDTSEEAMRLYSVDEEGMISEAGASYSLDDASGMSELMGGMSEREYRDVRPWVIEGARTQDGSVDLNRFMSPEALRRSSAILEELRSQGIEYSIKRDRTPGQIKAEVAGTKIGVRLTDVRRNEAYVGRVYDDGVATYYSTNVKVPKSNKTVTYEPTPQEAVDLLRVTLGQAVPRKDGKGVIGEIGTHTERAWDAGAKRMVPVKAQDSYFSERDKASMMAVGDLLGEDGKPVSQGAKVFIRRSGKSRSSSSRFFYEPEQAERFLREAIYSAKENLNEAIGVEMLIAQFRVNEQAALDAEFWPEFSGDQEIAAIQRSYWDVLRGAQTTLLRPGATAEEYAAKVGVIGELVMDTDESRRVHDMLVEDLAYTGTAEERVLDHSSDVLNDLIGSYDLHERVQPDGTITEGRFDPTRVAKYMTSEFGDWRNWADVVAALRASGIDGSELFGSERAVSDVRDRLITFDQATARTKEAWAAEGQDVLADAMTAVESAISRNGSIPRSILMDDNGIIRWEADRMGRDGKTSPVTGHIGQVFGRGEHGEVVTKFAGGDNYLFVPGYEARILAQKPGEDLSVEERTRVRGYEQLVADQIGYRVANDLLDTRSEVGDPTGLNGVYHHLYSTRHDVDFISRSAEEGLSPEWVDAILATEGRRVRYSSEIAAESTVRAAWKAENGRGEADPANDNYSSPWILTGQRNMAIMTEEGDGYFDPVMTNGAVYQGVLRYMTEGAEVTADGRIIPGDKDDRAPLMKMPETAEMRFDPYDRKQMSASKLMNASRVTKPVGVAMMTFGGWTADDPMVVSKEFAEEHGIRGADGLIRALVPGDKLSDLHGNKGVISLVVDRDMDLDEAREAGLENEVAWFKKNSHLDVVMSPFSAVSRFNGGTARELMKNPLNLDRPFVNEDGSSPEPVEGGLGFMSLVVTHKGVESGTRVYDDEALREGRGRKASAQLAWALGSQGCDEVMAEFYGPNTSASSNFREMLITMGLDMEADGTLRIGRDDLADGAERRLFEMPPLQRTVKGSLNVNRMRADFGDLIGTRGGDLEIPFPLRMPSGERTPTATDSTWRLPVLSSHLRSGQNLDDGTNTAHEYTNQYLMVHEMASRYRAAKEDLTNEQDLTEKRRFDLQQIVAEAPRRAQAAFDTITDDLARRRFSGKRNVYREGLMASRLPNSATAVWTSDPRLDIDQMAMGPAMMEALGLQEGDHALVWRDPVLRDGGVRYLRVKADERLTGVAINPVIDKSFDGDFDGDSVAVVRLTSESARRQALQKLSMEANLLDLGQFTDEGYYPLAIHNSLDVKVSQHFDGELKERFEALSIRANEIQSDIEEGTITMEEAWDQQHALVGELSSYYSDAMSSQFGDATLRFGSVGDHVRSVIEGSVETGAKGSMSKIEDYCRHLGVDPATMEDLGDTAHTREEDQGVMMAVAVKSHGTGIAGTFSQRGVRSLRNAELKSVLELTYPVTQSILQSKHDPVEAAHKFDMLMGPARGLWRGRVLEAQPVSDGERAWAVARVEGKEEQADVETWKRQFIDFYSSKDGLNVPVSKEHVDRVAAALAGPDGKIVDIEDPQQVELLGDKASTMDRLAYGGDFSALLSAAANRENIFAGSENRHFAPYAVRRAQRELAEAEASMAAGLEVPELTEQRVFANKDVLAEHDPKARERGIASRGQHARSVRAPRPLQVGEEQAGAASSTARAVPSFSKERPKRRPAPMGNPYAGVPQPSVEQRHPELFTDEASTAVATNELDSDEQFPF